MSSKSLELGRQGEEAAAGYLKKHGYKIIKADYHTALGQVDIIARDKSTVCFVEVKLRSSAKFGAPEEAVDTLKQKKISRTALLFLKKNKLIGVPARFDVVSVYYTDNKPRIELIKDAFPLDAAYL
jgi:putative endonuclease